ncbi:peptidase M50 [Campylobacter sp. VBCF_06 NA8]|uniref:peptidase M50 n=1 Tax=Campylobacter sp. VBCF_06 NA8 TaxID=2983822 RepID=UPI0022E998E8|nr:peptidase M50 [Campylobacter sp. VBCF_06 NA8]MDA3046853.1 peptidase M50 [Campylobacter sp. VBCF_06 NA8]
MNFSTFSPPFRIVGGYFICGLVFLALSIFGFYNADFYGLTSLKTASFFHIFLLGFALSIIIGALYQLTSVIIENKFFSTKFAFANLFVFASSVAILSIGMILEKLPLLHAGGGIAMMSLLFFGTSYALSFVKAKSYKTPSIALIISSIYLIIGIILGFLLVLVVTGASEADFSRVLAYHIYFMCGFVFFVIVGAGCVLLPMFSLAHDLSFLPAKISILLYLICVFFVKFGFGIYLCALAFAIFGVQIIYILSKRVRRKIDYWSANIFLSLVALVLGFCLWNFNKTQSAIFCLCYGFLYAFICAHLYKIAPFLIWYHYVSPYVGKGKIPLLEDMIIKNLAYFAIFANIVALIFAVFEINVIALIFQALSIIFVAINIINVFKYTKFGVENGRNQG